MDMFRRRGMDGWAAGAFSYSHAYYDGSGGPRYIEPWAASSGLALSWLNRQRGAWLQGADSRFHCRNSLLNELAEMVAEPHAFGIRGRAIMATMGELRHC